MVTRNTPLRIVEIDGKTYEIPTGVSWRKQRRCWAVYARLNQKTLTEYFHPSQYMDDVELAFVAACKFAVVKRHKYPSIERQGSGLRLSSRNLDGRPAFPLGIACHRVENRKTRNPDNKDSYVLVVMHNSQRVKYVRIGPVEGYTDAQYNRALRIATRTLTRLHAQEKSERRYQENFRQEYMTHADQKNPLSQMLYSLVKNNRTRRRIDELENVPENPDGS